MESVRAWAAGAGFAYRVEDDALFDRLPAWVRAKTKARAMVAADLARLLWLVAVTREEGRPAIWLDADVLVTDPAGLSAALDLSDGYLLGRESWVALDRRGRPRARPGVHNALVAAAPENPFVPFYIEAATRLLARHDGPMVPQLIGPKLLALWDNAFGLPATPAVNMASPLLLADLSAGGGPALNTFQVACPRWPAAFNLCQSYCGRRADGVAVTEALLATAQARLQAVGSGRAAG